MFENARLHVASFDAVDGDKYNNENCEQAHELFQSQQRVKVRFWCLIRCTGFGWESLDQMLEKAGSDFWFAVPARKAPEEDE